MRAAVLYGENGLCYQEVETPHAGPGEVVVRVKACGVCATDVKILARESTPRSLPPFWAMKLPDTALLKE